MGKATQWDRLTVMAIAAALSIWMACLVVFWTLPFGPWGGSLVLGSAMAMLAVGVSARLPGWLVRSIHGFKERFHVGPARVEELASNQVDGSNRDSVRGQLRLLAGSTVLAAICGGLSSLAAMLLDSVVLSLSSQMYWTRLSWVLLQSGMQFISFLPLGIGATLVFLVSTLLRAGRGHDAYADAARDWLWGIAGGLVIFALARGVGVNLAGLAMAMGAAMLALAGAVFARTDFSRRPGRLIKPIETPTELRRLALETTLGAMTIGLMLQLRALSDVWQIGLAGQAGWVAITFGLVAWFLGKVDAKRRLPGRRQGAGCQIGLVSALAIQLSLIALSGISRAHLLSLWYLPVAGQIPIAAMVAQLLCRQRQLFVNAGGRPRGYLSGVGVGVAAGLLIYLLALLYPALWVVLPVLALVLVVFGFVQMTTLVGQKIKLGQWVVVGLSVVVSLAVWVGLTRHDLHGRLGQIAMGRWTSRVGFDLAGQGHAALQDTPWHSEGVGRQVKQLAGQGRWWIVAFDLSEVHQSLPYYIQPVAGAPDVGAIGPGSWYDTLENGPHRDWLEGTAVGMGHFDGILLSSVPADSCEAWRVYNLRTLQRAADQLLVDSRTGVSRPLLIRTTVHSGQMGTVLAIAQTLRQVVGSGWMAAQFYDDRADILLAGPVPPEDLVERIKGRVANRLNLQGPLGSDQRQQLRAESRRQMLESGLLPAPEPGQGVFVIRLGELLDAMGPVQPIRVFRSPGWLDRNPDIAEVIELLKARTRRED